MAHFEDSLKTVANYPKLAIAIVYCCRLPIMYSFLGVVAIFSLEMQAVYLNGKYSMFEFYIKTNLASRLTWTNHSERVSLFLDLVDIK